jgi:alanine racemase
VRPITATIDLRALRHNLRVVKARAPGSRVAAVIKANAYGHGVVRAARALSAADGFAVVELEAAVSLRSAGYAQRLILLEGFFEPRELAVIVDQRIATAVHNAEQLDMLEALPAGAGVDVLLKINSGMNRLGFQPEAAAAALARIKANRGVGAISLMTHFANADDPRGIAWQLERLTHAVGSEPLPRTLANSAAILRYPEAHADWVRPGIMLYGCSPFAESIGVDLGLEPAMTLASQIIAVRDLAAGETVGYGGTFTAERAMRLGVVACGYADGYPRHAPTGTPVLVGDRLTRTIGRVSMDMLCVDLANVPDARVGTPVVLWGAANPIENVASAAGTVGYELMCAVAPRVRIVEKP